jgi:hypothetical protein
MFSRTHAALGDETYRFFNLNSSPRGQRDESLEFQEYVARSYELPKIALLNINYLRSHMLPQRRLNAEKALETWTREVKPDIGRSTHLKTSRAFNLAYWEGYRDAIRNLEKAIG